MIQLPVPADWTFWDFVYLNGTNPIEDWYNNELSDDGRFLFDSALKDCSKMESPRNWTVFKRFLKGGDLEKFRIWELQFSADGRQYRVLGIFGEKRKQAVFLIGCYHKGSVYTPPEALQTACKRAGDLKEGRAKLNERKIRTDQ